MRKPRDISERNAENQIGGWSTTIIATLNHSTYYRYLIQQTTTKWTLDKLSTYRSPTNCRAADKAQANKLLRMPNVIHQIASPSYFTIIHIIIIVLIALPTNFRLSLCESTQSTINLLPKECNPGGDLKFEYIEPTFLRGGNNVGNNKTEFHDVEQTTSSSLITPLSANVNCTDILKLQFSGFGDRFVIDLVKNKRLISDRYFEISKDNINRHGRHPDASSKDSSDLNDGEFYKNHVFLDLHNFTTNDDHCHYHGFVNGNLNSISAISIVDHKLLSGFFHDGRDIYYLHANTSTSVTILTKSHDLCGSKRPLPIFGHDNGATNSTKTSIAKQRSPRSTNKRRRSSSSTSDNHIMHEPFMSNSSSLYVELLIVHDHSQYTEYKGNKSNIAERTMQIVNIMNAFYRQLNIFVALVGVVLWTEKDEIQLTDDGDVTLTNFLKYRYEKLLPKYHHDNAQLITNTSFNGSVVGKALKGPICTHEHSGGVNTDHSHSPAIVAVTLAHELGHNLGMEHDEEEKCKCPDEKCIMSSSSSTVHPKRWSSCSIEYLEDAREHGLLDCLIDEPKKVFGPVCGNGFVEDGEDCDVGEPIPTYNTSKRGKHSPRCAQGQDCDPTPSMNPCCDRQTCKFVANATCAQGPCCDLSSCSVYNATEVKTCRGRKNECDLEEVCNGKSEYCPPDVHYHDGIECGPTISTDGQRPTVGSSNYNRSLAYCYNGKCASHESQCQLLWGPTGSVSKDICYEQNIHGNTSGNCGYNRKEKTYESCELDNSICGMLHCVHNQPSTSDSKKTGKLGYGFESASILTVSFFVMKSSAKIYCHGAIIDAGPGVRDPGLVPNGAACGINRMCLDQKCVPVSDVIYDNWCPSDCNGNGICDNKGVCHCHDGTIGTSCYDFFGPNFHLSLLFYIFLFFVPMIALIVFTINHYKKQIKIWWFLHNRMMALREKGRESNHLRMPPDVSRNNVTISEPIPLSQHNNVNRLFYEPNSTVNSFDPWTETSCEASSRPLGYRLEPLASQSHSKPVRVAPPPPVPTHEPNKGGGS